MFSRSQKNIGIIVSGAGGAVEAEMTRYSSFMGRLLRALLAMTYIKVNVWKHIV
jgi:hypothetical protein